MQKLIIKGKTILFDAADWPLIRQYRWNIYKDGYTYYARARINGKLVGMHRLIMGEHPTLPLIDHADGDGLDNRRANLRFCTYAENAHNRWSAGTATSQYRGVHRMRNGTWSATITHQGRQRWYSGFRTEVEAALRYNQAAIHFYGPIARLNDLNSAA